MKSQWTGFQSALAGDIERFLAHKRALGRKYGSEERALRIFDRFLVEDDIGSLDEITPELIVRFLTSRRRPRPRGYNELLGVVRRLFDWMVGQGLLARSPVQATPRRQTAQRIPFLFSRDQARTLLEEARRLPDNPRAPLRGQTYRAGFGLMYGLGLRVGEVSRLCWRDIDLDRRLLVIRQTKFAKDRLVPFGPRVAGLLREFRSQRSARGDTVSPEGPVFSFGRQRSVHPGTFSQTFRHVVPRLGLDVPSGTSPPRLHDLRHSFAVGTLLRWYREGIDPADRLHRLSTFMGHSDPTSTAVYLTITSDLLQQANDRFERFAEVVRQEVSP